MEFLQYAEVPRQIAMDVVAEAKGKVELLEEMFSNASKNKNQIKIIRSQLS